MYVRVDLDRAPPRVTLEEPEDTARFHVEVSGGTDRGLVFGALVDAAAGRLEGDDAWITVDSLRRMAAGRVGAGWQADLDAMLEFARTKGWLDPASHSLRAHVEWPAS